MLCGLQITRHYQHIIIIVDIAENVYSCYNRGRITENTTKECKFVIIKAHKYLSILQ